MESIKTQGIVLRHYNYSENSLLVHFFTEKVGKVNALVKGAKKPKGRFFGKLGLGCVVDLILIHRSRSDLHLLTDVSLVDAMEPLRLDLLKFSHAMVLLEVVDAAFEVEHPNPEFYQDLIEGFQAIAQKPMDLWMPVLLHLRMLHALGSLPAQSTCQECGKDFEGRFYFSLSAGASLCRSCLPREESAVIGESWQLPYLRRVVEDPFSICAGLVLSELEKRRFFGWTRKCLDGVVHKRIRSYEFLAKVSLDVK
jgi:DNA repair protein RecO (recombination protein O)